jgi:hypothetical protein
MCSSIDPPAGAEARSFVLFWSRAARASKWVDREWRHRLRHRGLHSITPNAPVPPQSCPSPSGLAGLQLGSRLLEIMRTHSTAAPRAPAVFAAEPSRARTSIVGIYVSHHARADVSDGHRLNQ